MSARANEASAEREKLERVQHELLQGLWECPYSKLASFSEKQRFNIPNAINMLITEADHISEDDGEVSGARVSLNAISSREASFPSSLILKLRFLLIFSVSRGELRYNE